MNTSRTRITDVANLGFEVEIPAPMADHPHGDVTTEVDGSFKGSLAVPLNSTQLAALRRVQEIRAALVLETWEEDRWKAGPRMHLQEPLDIAEVPDEDGRYAVVMHFQQIVH